MFNTEFPFNLENGSHYMPISPARMGREKIFIRAPPTEAGKADFVFHLSGRSLPDVDSSLRAA